MSTDRITDPNKGIVFKKNTGIYTVHLSDRSLNCTLSPRLRAKTPPEGRGRQKVDHTFEHTDPVAVGDVVLVSETGGGSGQITAVEPRRNHLSRPTATPMPGAHAFEQIIAANVDQVVPVFAAANPAPKWGMLDRYLVMAEAAGVPAVICITKLDLAMDENGRVEADLLQAAAEYRQAGYPVLLASANSRAGLDEVRETLAGRMSVLMGKSGVGKTSLLNALQPGLGLRVNAVSQITGKGKHTTTHLEMFELDFGGSILDTPGVREFGLWDISEDELPGCFPEMRPYLGQCRFGLNCRHDEEPGCAVRKAVTAGQISPRRWQSYLHLRAEA
ncbi:MAG TPA: ribosome small subunit-dependent GTPase A [Anaerolineaceae bacterium]|nr:ribosome small subunit-dependent GTPase A [Anaerolineaceae bacterium]HPN51857.1 ribosome small subunit-dependent GTPase A [Anaerolineaceae bacterium]